MRRRQISRLTGSGDVAAADQSASSELQAVRRAVERDRYGLMAYVLMARDRCTPSSCAAFRALADHRQIVANMDERVYENLITRYSAAWNAPPLAAPGLVAALPPSVPTGKPTNADFPSAASTPPVNIMGPEPGSAPAQACGPRGGSAGPTCTGTGAASPAGCHRGGCAARSGGGQEAAGAETDAGRPGADLAGTDGVIHSACGHDRMIVFKSVAAR